MQIRRSFGALASALVVATTLVATSPVPASAAIVPPTFLRTMGFSGHAGVYAWGMATAIDGTILTSDYNNYVIRRYSTSGTLLQSFSGVGSGPCQNFQPYGITVDPNSGTIYMLDTNNGQLETFAPNGTCIRSVNMRANGAAYTPRMAVNPQGLVYVVNSHNLPNFNNSIMIYNSAGAFVRSVPFGTATTVDGRFNTIRGIAIDPVTGEVYMNDAGNGRVQVFSPDLSTYLRKFGTPGPTSCAGCLSGDLRGMAIDKANNWIYISDPAQGQVEKYTLGGQYVGTLTVPGPDGTSVGSPRDVTVGLDHNVYVADYGSNQILVYDTNMNNILAIPNPPQPAPNGGLNQPEGVAVNNATGNVYVTDTFNNRMQEFSQTGSFIRTWGYRSLDAANGMSYPRGLWIDQTNGNIFMNNTRGANIKRYDSNGNYLGQFGSEGSGTGQYFYARGIVGATNRLYIPDSGNLRFVATDRSGNVVWTRPCGTRGSSFVLLGCTSATVDASGNVYTAGVVDNALYKFSPTGTLIWKRIYARGAGQGQLNQPYGVAVRGSLLYVSDMGNNRISVFDLNGTFQGTFGSAGAGNGQLRKPMAITIDSAGRIYVCENTGERISVWQLR
jgi:tripartite motif-containing protein 71